MIAKAKSNIARHKRHPLYYRRISEEKTPGENLSGIGQSDAVATGHFGDMELHATDLITFQTHQELSHQNRAKPLCRTHPFLRHRRLAKAMAGFRYGV